MCVNDFWSLFGSVLAVLAILAGLIWFMYENIFKRDMQKLSIKAKEYNNEATNKLTNELYTSNAISFFNLAVLTHNLAVLNKSPKMLKLAYNFINEAKMLYVKLSVIEKINECDFVINNINESSIFLSKQDQ